MLARSTKSLLLKKIIEDFNQFTFQQGDSFAWQSRTNTIVYSNGGNFFPLLLHEIAHALLGHKAYGLDIDLLNKENAAWQHALQVLAPVYSLEIDESFIELCLDDYRAWLYKRSLCPACGQTGLQIKKNVYSCINCGGAWKTNDARQCGLRRVRLT
ncbi:MAG TPA: hypothetical protein VNG90_03845 [Candidatus Acidoferrum sp.]|nr:hypothetical protein [Candidatus Acidoferrum sp.]